MKTNWRPYRVVAVLVATLVLAGSPIQADVGDAARVVRVEATVDGQTVRILAQATGPFEYTTYRPSEHLFVVDLAGVTSSAPSGARVLKSDVVSSYRVLQYRAGDRAIVRLEVLMRTPVEPQVAREGNHLQVTFGSSAAPALTKAPAPAGAPVTAVRSKAAATRDVVRPATAIRKVDVNLVAGQTQVRIEGNGRLAYQDTRLTGPDRVVFDFGGARPAVASKVVPISLEPVRGVRIGQFKPGMTRVVIDLARAASYSVSAEENALVVSFGFGARAAEEPKAPVQTEPVRSAPSEPKEAETVPVSAKAEAAAAAPAPVKEVPAPAAEAKEEAKPQLLTVALSAPAAARPLPSEPVASEAISLPKSITEPAAVLASPAPARETPKPEPVAASPARASAAVPVALVPPQAQKYTGEPISVNLKDVDLKDFFRLIHEISGLNIVVDPNVRGTLTIVLDDVPWDQALDIVLKNNNLDKQLEGNVLRIATRDTLKKEAETSRDLAKAQAEAVDKVTHTRVLSYAKASSMSATLKRFLSSQGEILADERSNTLIIRDIPGVFPDLDNLIRQLDKRSQQVEIEARVVSATRTFAREIGTQFGFATTSTGGRSIYGGLVGNSSFVSPIERGAGLPPPPLVSSGSNSVPFNTNLRANAPTSGFTFAHASPNFALDFVISAAESKGVGKLLSKPRVITQNNEKATVKQGTKIPIQTVVNNTISTQFVNAVLQLEVTPQITADGTIFMEVKVENTAIDNGIPRVQGIPALATQEAETKVTISDGGTVVIGGVIISSQRTDISQVPLLGSIPLIGHLFKRTSVSTNNQELLFFLTPRILPG